MNKRLKILVVGCGGREHAIIKKFYSSSYRPKLYCYGTYKNPGILSLVDVYASNSTYNVEEIVEFAQSVKVDFVFIGGEECLEKGLVNALDEVNIKSIGPTKELAQLETSKSYCRRLLQKYGMSKYNPEWKSFDCNNHPSIITLSSSFTDNNSVAAEASFQEMKSRQFSSIEQSVKDFMLHLKGDCVIKVDGLKGGKGVWVSGDHFSSIEEGVDICRTLYNNKERFLIEEKLQGEEFSLFTFCDGGNFYKHCPLVKDYKRLKNDNEGPNTGGMGSFSLKNSKMPFLTDSELDVVQKLNENVCTRLMFENNDDAYIGILYGSYMKTNLGQIKIIEFNVRFGDPEAINVLALLDSDLCTLCLDMLSCNLNRTCVEFRKEDSKCVYIVPKNYALSSQSSYGNNNNNDDDVSELLNFCKQHNNIVIAGIDYSSKVEDNNDNSLFNNGDVIIDMDSQLESQSLQSSQFLQQPILNQQPTMTLEPFSLKSTKNNQRKFTSTGSRLLAVYAVGKDISDLDKFLNSIKNDNYYYRSDIGKHFLSDKQNTNLYSAAGVNIDTKNSAVKSIHKYAKQSHSEYVIDNEGGFGGLIRLPSNDDLVLINSTDSVGSKSSFVRKWWGPNQGMKSLGYDIVNHCVNDILVQSPYTKPWTFMDYYATHHLDPVELRSFISGVSEACKQVGCVLIGGETAEIPGIYREGCNDLVGAITGIVSESKLLYPHKTICSGDLVYAIPSNSPHTNGYTLIQKLIVDSIKNNDYSYLRFVDNWCEPHRCYLKDITSIVDMGIDIKGMCHITGGGFVDNPVRIIDNTKFKFEFDTELIIQTMPPWMKWLHEKVIEGGSDFNEVFKTFNCGYGMLVVVDPSYHDKLLSLSNEKIIGKFIGKITNISSNNSSNNTNVETYDL